MQGKIVGNVYQLDFKIGSGSFGEIWNAVHLQTGARYAVKLEDEDVDFPQLIMECKIYLWLQSDPTSMTQSIPLVRYYATEIKKNLMVMDLLGENLDTLFRRCNRKFTLKTVVLIADQILKRIEYVHYRRIIHRDIKPENFTIGLGTDNHKIFIIDFGLAKKVMNQNGEHIRYIENKGITGTARYASTFTHTGIEQSRRDDLESLGYVLIYFLKGTLPWMNAPGKDTNEKYKRIGEIKQTTSIETLCFGLPNEFVEYMQYVRSLKFDEKPNYELLRGLFKDVAKAKGINYDFEFDWSEKKGSKKTRKA